MSWSHSIDLCYGSSTCVRKQVSKQHATMTEHMKVQALSCQGLFEEGWVHFMQGNQAGGWTNYWFMIDCCVGIDSNAHRFGAVDKSGVLNGVQKCLNPDSDLSTPPATHIVNKVVEDARTVGGEYLGTVKRLGAGDRNISKDFCFGKPSLKAVRCSLAPCCQLGSGGFFLLE